MEENVYNKHYIRLDADGDITDGWSDGPLADKPTDGAILYNEQGGYQFRLEPGGEENPPLRDEWGNPMYRYDSAMSEITANAIAEPDPAAAELAQLEEQLWEMFRREQLNIIIAEKDSQAQEISEKSSEKNKVISRILELK